MLVALDFEGTLAKTDPYVRLGEKQGTGDAIAGILDRMAGGDVGFGEGYRSVADLLEGLPVADAEDALEGVRIDPDASELLASIEGADHHVAVVSDAPERAIESCHCPVTFDVDTVVTNRLPTADGALTGAVEGPLLGRSKADVLEELATGRGLALSETLALGTDRRDLPMLQAAGTGIGLDPDPVVEAECDHVVPSLVRVREWLDEANLI